MRMSILSLIMAGLCLGSAGAQGEWKPVAVGQNWTLVAPKDQVAKLDDNMDVNWKKKPNVIMTPAAWKEVWMTLAPDQKVPDLDFGKNLVLVHFQDKNDPNKVKHNVQINNEGQLRLLSISTLIGFESSNMFKVQLMQVPREGVKSLQVPGKGVVPIPAM